MTCTDPDKVECKCNEHELLRRCAIAVHDHMRAHPKLKFRRCFHDVVHGSEGRFCVQDRVLMSDMGESGEEAVLKLLLAYGLSFQQ